MPAGFKLVVRDIDASCNAGSSGGGLFFVGNIGQTIWNWTFPASGRSSAQWRGRQVFESGQQFEIQVSTTPSTPVSFQVSGYKLTLP